MLEVVELIHRSNDHELRSVFCCGEMAQKENLLEPETFCCWMCLDPMAVPCGHNSCTNCIKTYCDEEGQKKRSCPQCRNIFTPRPNTMLADLPQEVKSTGLQAVPEKKLQENICSRQDEVMKMSCHTDQQRICCLCCVEEHKGPDTVSDATERTERHRELEGSRQRIQQRIQDREKDVKLLQQEVKAISHSADTTVEDSEKIFTELIRLLEKRRSEVKQQIRSQQEAEASRLKELQEKLEQEITELKRKDAELEQLSHTVAHNQFLHNYPSLSAFGEATDLSSISVQPRRYFKDVMAAVSELRDKLQYILRDTWTKASRSVTVADALPHLSDHKVELKTRADFLQYSCQITLDPNTAHTYVFLSEGNRKATLMSKQQPYPSHSERFAHWQQVLGRQSLTGRCYWEVRWRGTGVHVAVSYKDLHRDGRLNEHGFGRNRRSWALLCYVNAYSFLYNNSRCSVSGPRSSTIGVYLDHRAGLLSFYSVSEAMTLLHRVQSTFTEPLYAGVSLVYNGDSTEFCRLR